MPVIPVDRKPLTGPYEIVGPAVFLPGKTGAEGYVHEAERIFGIAGHAGDLVQLAAHLQEGGVRLRLVLAVLGVPEVRGQAAGSALEFPHPGEPAPLHRRVVPAAVLRLPAQGLVVVLEFLRLRRRIGGVLLKENSNKLSPLFWLDRTGLPGRIKMIKIFI